MTYNMSLQKETIMSINIEMTPQMNSYYIL